MVSITQASFIRIAHLQQVQEFRAQTTAKARAAATPPIAHCAFPVTAGRAALVEVDCVFSALAEAAVLVVVELEPVEVAVEAEAESPVVAEAPVWVAVMWTAW